MSKCINGYSAVASDLRRLGTGVSPPKWRIIFMQFSFFPPHNGKSQSALNERSKTAREGSEFTTPCAKRKGFIQEPPQAALFVALSSIVFFFSFSIEQYKFFFLLHAAHTMGGFNSSRERKYLMVVSGGGA
jgi:hypothetical protein